MPIRAGGLQGVPIKDAAHEWQGYIPFDQMPNAFDPPAGFLATANARVTTDKSPYPLTLEWTEPYRAQRITELLRRKAKLTPDDIKRARKLIAAGERPADVAESFHVGRTTLYRALTL